MSPRGERPAAHPSAVVALRHTRMPLLDTHRESPPLLLHTTRRIPSRQRPRRSDALDAPPPPKKKRAVTVQVPRASSPAKRRSGRVPAETKTTNAEPEMEWEVEKIMDSGVNRPTGVHLYLVKWKGFSNKENTWEPRMNLSKCHKLLRDFEMKH